MSDAPERIYVAAWFPLIHGPGRYAFAYDRPYDDVPTVEHIRADIHDAEVARLREIIHRAHKTLGDDCECQRWDPCGCSVVAYDILNEVIENE